MFNHFATLNLIRNLPEAEVIGSQSLQEIPSQVPCIFIYSHKQHDTDGLGHETRQLTLLAKDMPGNRTMRHIVREADSHVGKIKQRLSPLHTVIVTAKEEPVHIKRGAMNKKILGGLVHSTAKQTNTIISIAPDSGRTTSDYPDLVNPDIVSTGGVLFLLNSLTELHQTHIPVIPIAFDHHRKRIVIGNDIAGQISNAEKPKLPLLLADSLNSLLV